MKAALNRVIGVESVTSFVNAIQLISEITALMLSPAGHPFWAAYTKVLTERAAQGTTPQFDSPMYMSGTLALTRTLMDFITNPGIHRVTGYTSWEYEVSVPPFLEIAAVLYDYKGEVEALVTGSPFPVQKIDCSPFSGKIEADLNFNLVSWHSGLSPAVLL